MAGHCLQNEPSEVTWKMFMWTENHTKKEMYVVRSSDCEK